MWTDEGISPSLLWNHGEYAPYFIQYIFWKPNLVLNLQISWIKTFIDSCYGPEYVQFINKCNTVYAKSVYKSSPLAGPAYTK